MPERAAPVVDIHSHAVPVDLLEEVASGAETFPGVGVERHESSFVLRFADAAPTRPVAPGLLDAGRRTGWMAERAIDQMVVAGWVDAFGYQLPGDVGAAWAERLTAALVDHCAPAGAVPLATLPMQDPERAASALAAAVKGGLPGAMIATKIGEKPLDDPSYTPLFEAADQLGAVLYLHPAFGSPGPSYHDYGLVNGLGRVEDSTVAVARLLYAGIPGRYPNMRLIVSHGGGSLPYVIGRLARNWLISGKEYADPVEQLGFLYFDSVVFDPASLDLLLARVGPDKVMLGSDYPFPIGDPDPCHVVESSGLSESDRKVVLGCQACSVFGIDHGSGSGGR